MTKLIILSLTVLLISCSQETFRVEVGGIKDIGSISADLRIQDELGGGFPATSLGAESAPKMFKVENIGSVDASALAFSLGPDFKFAGGNFPGENGTCSTSLLKGESCYVEIIFTPSVLGDVQDKVSLSYESSGKTIAKEAPLQGKSSDKLSLFWTDLSVNSFPTTFVGSSSQLTVRVQNESSVDTATVITPIFNHSEVSLSSTTCGGSLAPSAFCDFVLEYSPLSKISSQFKFEVSYQDGLLETKKLVRYLSINSIFEGVLSVVSPNGVDFGSRFPSEGKVSQVVALQNLGDSDITSFDSLLSEPFELEDATINNCVAPIAAGATCNVLVSYTPTVEDEFETNTLLEYESAGTTKTLGLNVKANTLLGSSLVLSRNELNFAGKVITFQRIMTVKLTNSGDQSITGLAITGPSSVHFAYEGTTCPEILAPRAECEVSLSFTPGVDGELTSSASIAYSIGGVNDTRVLPLKGTGYAANSTGVSSMAFFLTEDEADFATVLPSTTTPYRAGGISIMNGGKHKVLYLKNMGNFLSQIQSITLNGNINNISWLGGSFPGTGGTCTTTHFLAPGETCSVVVLVGVGSPSYASFKGYSDPVSSYIYPRVQFWSGGVVNTRNDFFSFINYNHAITFAADSLSFNPIDLDNGDTAIEADIVLRNRGDFSIENLNLTVPSSEFSLVVGGTCGSSIAVDEECTVRIRFESSVPGSYSRNLGLSYTLNGVNRNFNYPLNGSVINDETRGPTQLAFFGSEDEAGLATILPSTNTPYRQGGMAIANGGKYKVLYLKNMGNYHAQVQSITLNGNINTISWLGGSFPGTGGTCSTTNFLAPNETCSVVVLVGVGSPSYASFMGYVSTSSYIYPRVQFWSGGVVNTRNDFFNFINYNQAITFAADSLSFNPIDLDNGDTAIEADIVLRNRGDFSIENLNLTVPASEFSLVVGGTCGSSIAVDEDCTVRIRFESSVPGSYSRNLGLSYTLNGVNRNFNYPLNGSVINDETRGPTQLAFFGSESEANLATVLPSTNTPYRTGGVAIMNGGKRKALYLKNLGSYSAQIQGVTLSANINTLSWLGGSFPGTGGTCVLNSFLGPGETCSLEVVVGVGSPSYSSFMGYINPISSYISPRLQFWSGGVVNTRQDIFSFINYNQAVSFEANSLVFGTIDMDSGPMSSERILTLRNIGDAPIVSINFNLTSSHFSYTGGSFPGTNGTCTNELDIEETCDIDLTFAPSTIGHHSINFGIGYTITTPVNIPYPLQGSAVSDGNI